MSEKAVTFSVGKNYYENGKILEESLFELGESEEENPSGCQSNLTTIPDLNLSAEGELEGFRHWSSNSSLTLNEVIADNSQVEPMFRNNRLSEDIDKFYFPGVEEEEEEPTMSENHFQSPHFRHEFANPFYSGFMPCTNIQFNTARGGLLKFEGDYPEYCSPTENQARLLSVGNASAHSADVMPSSSHDGASISLRASQQINSNPKLKQFFEPKVGGKRKKDKEQPDGTCESPSKQSKRPYFRKSKYAKEVVLAYEEKKRVEKRERNRVLAAESRHRQKLELNSLKNDKAKLTEDLAKANKEIKNLQNQLQNVSDRLAQYEDVPSYFQEDPNC